MPKQKQDGQLGEQPERELPRGVKLLRTLEGHNIFLYSVAFDPEGGTLASGDHDYIPGTPRFCSVRSLGTKKVKRFGS